MVTLSHHTFRLSKYRNNRGDGGGNGLVWEIAMRADFFLLEEGGGSGASR